MITKLGTNNNNKINDKKIKQISTNLELENKKAIYKKEKLTYNSKR